MVYLDSVTQALHQLSHPCCFGLKTGCLILGGVHFTLGVFMEYFGVLAMLAMERKRLESPYEPPASYYPSYGYPYDYNYGGPSRSEVKADPVILIEVFQGIFVFTNSVHTALALLLLVGVIQNSEKTMKFWMIAQMTMTVVLIFQTLAMVMFNDTVTEFHTDDYFYPYRVIPLAEQLKAFWMFHTLGVFTILFVKSHYTVVKRSKQQNLEPIKT